MNTPREFWLDKGASQMFAVEPISNSVHVIEFSAYERLRQALTEIREKTSPEYAVYKIADEALQNPNDK